MPARLLVVTILSLELIVDLEEARSLDDLVLSPERFDVTDGADVVTVLCTLVGIVLVVDLVADSDGEVDIVVLTDGVPVILDVVVEVLTDLLVRGRPVELVDRRLVVVLLDILLSVDGLEVRIEEVAPEDVRVEVVLLTEGALDLVAGAEAGLEDALGLAAGSVVLEGELAAASRVESAVLLLRSADPEEPDLSPLAKHGAKSNPKTTAPNIKLFFILFNANMINLLSATKFLIAALTAT